MLFIVVDQIDSLGDPLWARATKEYSRVRIKLPDSQLVEAQNDYES
jgi:hypothetical protein